MRLMISDDARNEVVLAVDPGILTADLASEINGFWSGGQQRLQAEDGDVVRTVARMFGAAFIACAQADGGVNFEGDEAVARFCVQQTLDAQGEGWPGIDQLGIEVQEAHVSSCGYFDVEVLEMLE